MFSTLRSHQIGLPDCRSVRKAIFPKIFFYLFFLLLLHSPSYAGSSYFFLGIRNQKDDRILFTTCIHPGDTFIYSYMHSLEKLPVYETFRVAENQDLVLVETRLKSLSASGMIPAPEDIVWGKEEIRVKSDRRFKALQLRISYFHRQQIIFPEKKVELNELAAAGDPIELKILRECEKGH